jgi:hypothetical protein
MFERAGVFARDEKVDRIAPAKARDVGASARIDPTAKDLAKLIAKAEIGSVVSIVVGHVDCSF